MCNVLAEMAQDNGPIKNRVCVYVSVTAYFITSQYRQIALVSDTVNFLIHQCGHECTNFTVEQL